MFSNIKQIEVDGKTYTLTARRSIIYKISEVCPEMMKIAKNSTGKTTSEITDEIMQQSDALDTLYDNMPIFFYELIRRAHQDITREKSDEIYLEFCREYNDVDSNLMHFIQSVFTGGVPSKNKKNLNW